MSPYRQMNPYVTYKDTLAGNSVYRTKNPDISIE